MLIYPAKEDTFFKKNLLIDKNNHNNYCNQFKSKFLPLRDFSHHLKISENERILFICSACVYSILYDYKPAWSYADIYDNDSGFK